MILNLQRLLGGILVTASLCQLTNAQAQCPGTSVAGLPSAEMVANGNFEQNGGLNGPFSSQTIDSGFNCNTANVLNWGAYSIYPNNIGITPDYYVKSGPDNAYLFPRYTGNAPYTLTAYDPSNTSNNAFVGFQSTTNSRGKVSEGISTRESRTAATAGKWYKARAWVYTESTSNDIAIDFYFHNNYSPSSSSHQRSEMGTAILRNTFGYTQYPTYDGWTLIEANFQCVANPTTGGTSFSHLAIECAAYGYFYFDDISLVESCEFLVNGGEDQTICANSTATLTATGAASYQWYNGSTLVGSSATLSVTPTATTTYQVLGTTNGCTTQDFVTVTVNPQPAVFTINGPTGICFGTTGTYTVTPTAGLTYSWTIVRSGFSQSGTGTTIPFTPNTTGSGFLLTVTATNSFGCTRVVTKSLSSYPTPPAVTASNDISICPGTSTTLSANNSVTWSANGTVIGTGYSILVSPAATTTYRAYLTNGFGCVKEDFVNVTVGPLVGAPWFTNNPTCIPPTFMSPEFRVNPTNAVVTVSGGGLYPGPSGAGYYQVKPASNSPMVTVYAEIGDGCGGASDSYIQITVNSNCRIAKPGTPPANIYPNPATNTLNIESAKGESYKIFNHQGTEVKNGKFTGNKSTLNVQTLKKGIYFLHIKKGNEVEKHQIVIE